MEQMRSAYLGCTSRELKQKLVNLNGAARKVKNDSTRDGMHSIMNVIIDILKERNEL